MDTLSRLTSSFRDPSGFLFFKGKKLFRQVNLSYKENYDFLMSSGLYRSLTESNLIVRHEEARIKPLCREGHYKVIKPETVPFISYPYEWTFSQLKDAALITLTIMNRALDFGMILKDASAYNIQFLGSRPILIDTLSFEKYQEGKPWIGYRQFCQHFLAPLSLMAYCDNRLNSLLRSYVDGIPLDLANLLLPKRSKLRLGILLHLSFHAQAQKKYADRASLKKRKEHSSFSLKQLRGFIISLENTIKKLPIPRRITEWEDYYQHNCNYNDLAFNHKAEIVSKYIKTVNPLLVWDLGANDGKFSDLASESGIYIVAFDIDPTCVERNYLRQSAAKKAFQLPLLLDLTNPSPALGWNNNERESLIDRGPADLVLALALIHHLAVSNNVPLSNLASFFSRVSSNLIIEFVPKEDSQVQRLLASRKDIFSGYTSVNFEKEFSKVFSIKEKVKLNNSARTIYLMENKTLARH